MLVAERLTMADLTTSLEAVLERVHPGEQFSIELDSEVIATLAPPPTKPSITWGEFLALCFDLPRPDP